MKSDYGRFFVGGCLVCPLSKFQRYWYRDWPIGVMSSAERERRTMWQFLEPTYFSASRRCSCLLEIERLQRLRLFSIRALESSSLLFHEVWSCVSEPSLIEYRVHSEIFLVIPLPYYYLAQANPGFPSQEHNTIKSHLVPHTR